MKKKLKEVLYCFYPPKYKELKDKGFWKSYKFLLKVLLIMFIIGALLLIPQFVKLKSEITEDISKLNIKNISGKIETTEPIFIPSKNPLLTIDLESDRKMNKELFLITKEQIQFRFFGKKTIETKKLKDPAQYKGEVGKFVTSLLLLLTPGLALILFVKAAIKYLLITLLFGLLIFFLMDLTHYKLKLKKMLTITAYAAIPIVIIETLFAIINPAALFPFMRFLGLNIYAVTLAIWFFYTIVCVVLLYVKQEEKQENG